MKKILLLIIGLSSLNVFAQPMERDSSFGTDGLSFARFGTGEAYTYQIMKQSDGKILQVGYVANGLQDDFALTRYLDNGIIDSAFGINGTVITDLRATNDQSLGMALQDDGKILIAGYTSNGMNWDYAVARYLSTGALDTSFNHSGFVSTDLFNRDDMANAIDIQSDHKIVVAGNSNTTSGLLFTMVRYMPDGTIDTTFGRRGITFARAASVGIELGRQMKIMSDGKIMMAGTKIRTTTADFMVIRFLNDGKMDSTFGTNGRITYDFTGKYDYLYSMELHSDGSYILGGYTDDDSNSNSSLIKCLPDGRPDSSFNFTGRIVNTFSPADDVTYSVATRSDGKIWVSGYAFSSPLNHILISRYNADGSPDTAFANGGHRTYPTGTGSSIGTSLIIEPDGKLLVGASAEDGLHNRFCLLRLVERIPTILMEIDPLDQLALSVFPNPCAENLNLWYKLEEADELNISLYSMQGSLVQILCDHCQKPAGEQSETLGIPNSLASGSYLLRFESRNINKGIIIYKL